MLDSRADPARDGDAARYRIAFAIQRYFDFGGLQRDMLRVARACADRGHEVHILTGMWAGQKPDNVSVHLLDVQAITNHGYAWRFGKAVREFLHSNPYDCVVGFSRMPGLDVYWCGDPCHDALLEREKPALFRWLPRYRTYLKLERAVMRPGNTTDLLVLCPQEMERLIRSYHTEASRIHLLPAGIERHRFAISRRPAEVREQVRRELGISEGTFLALTVGSSFHTKGVDRAIRALAALPKQTRQNIALVVVGQGDAAPYRRLARRVGIADRVHFTGGRLDVANFYYAADILLHPARTETAGHTLLEALVCGLPVLVTENCGYAFHVEKAGAGLICPVPFSQEALNKQLVESLAPARREAWKQSALRYSSATDLYSMVEKSVGVILKRAARARLGAAETRRVA